MALFSIALAGLIVSLVGTAASIKEGRETQKRQKKQNKNIQAINSAKASAAKRQEFRAERVRRAQLAAQAEASGTSGSSTAIAGEGLSGTLASQKIGSISSALENTNVLSAGNQSIEDSRSRGQLFGNVAAIGSSVFTAAGGFGALDSPSATPKSNTSVPKQGGRLSTGIGGRRR